MIKSTLARHWALWAKSPQGTSAGLATDGYHPLIYHIIDVAAVAKALWPIMFAPAVRQRLCLELGLPDEETARRWVAFWAGLHDIGKGAPGFAHQWAPGWRLIGQAGFDLPDPIAEAPHSFISAKSLVRLLRDIGLPAEIAGPVARAVGGHHGAFPQGGDLQNVGLTALGSRAWEDTRCELALRLKTLCGLDNKPSPRGDLNLAPWLIMILAGFTSVADWVGSDEEFFPHTKPGMDLADYWKHARKQATLALTQLGWNQSQCQCDKDRCRLPFTSLFPYSPNALQDLIIQTADSLPAPALILVESPMGGGKTEAALYLADHWSTGQGLKGCYFALPTQATSNQMFGRIKKYLSKRYPSEIINVHLLHGHASLSAEYEALRQNADRRLKPSGIAGEPGYDGASANLVAAEWFTHRKRGLLADFGVGTVDQALLSVLQIRHYFVRLLGLAGKTVIIDEVHAYDAYMTQVLQRLLTWLASLGSCVVLLSATLPSQRREELIRAYAKGLGDTDPDCVPSVCYPRVTWYSVREKGSRTIPGTRERVVRLRWVDGNISIAPDGHFPLGDELRKALADGGCAVVICNTVGRAQQIYQALKPYFSAGELDLFHARYVFTERDAREKRTLARFGKLSEDSEIRVERPARFVLVATQVVEQSLDIDFDLVVTELAPVDLVLQRMGRLHRHERDYRPSGLLTPTVWLIQPQPGHQGLPSFGRAVEHVYHPHILLQSWVVLRNRAQITIPDDVEPLVESVYRTEPSLEDLPEQIHSAWQETRSKLEEKLARDKGLAECHLVAEPDPAGDLLARHNEQLEEENPKVAPSFQALTRLAEPSVPVVLLPEAEAAAIDLDAEPGREEILRLLGRSLTLTHGAVVPLLLKQATPAGWRRSPLLRHQRLLVLDQDGIVEVGDWRIQAHPELGILIWRGKESEW